MKKVVLGFVIAIVSVVLFSFKNEDNKKSLVQIIVNDYNTSFTIMEDNKEPVELNVKNKMFKTEKQRVLLEYINKGYEIESSNTFISATVSGINLGTETIYLVK